MRKDEGERKRVVKERRERNEKKKNTEVERCINSASFLTLHFRDDVDIYCIMVAKASSRLV